MITVYFDTSFYVWLARATDESADKALDALDAVDARVVLSAAVARELLSSVGREEQDEKLFERIDSLKQEPYRTKPWLEWEMLRAKGAPRREFADHLARLEPLEVRAESAAVLANSTYSHGDKKKAVAAHTIAQFDFPDDDAGKLEVLRRALAPLLELRGIEVPSSLTAEDLPALSAAILATLPPQAIEANGTRNRLIASSVATDERPFKVILGEASEKTQTGLAHTFRDAGGHMMEFVMHADAIDLFQMDGHQLRQVQRDPRHELRQRGLSDRCFSATSLDEALLAVATHAASSRRGRQSERP